MEDKEEHMLLRHSAVANPGGAEMTRVAEQSEYGEQRHKIQNQWKK